MNKYERIRRRIIRDKLNRLRKKAIKYKDYDNIEYVFTLQHYVYALKRCNKGVMWKQSVQTYNSNAVSNLIVSQQEVQDGKLPAIDKIVDVRIRERGKERIITPITINQRVPQKVFCDYSFLPMIKDSLIYDNGASLPSKGVDFARNRIMKHLRSAINEFGNDFYILQFDFKSYFDSIPHSTCRNVLSKYYSDERLIEYGMNVIKAYHIARARNIGNNTLRDLEIRKIQSEKAYGICLGSQVSQLLALVIPNELDHYIKDRCGVKYYVRYMDDGVIIAKTKEELKKLLAGMKDVCKRLGLTLHDKKTRIVKISKGFIFLKQKYNVFGKKIIKRLTRKGIVRMRRKLKRFKGLVEAGRMTLDDVYASMQSWMEHARGTKSTRTMISMLRLYNILFDGYLITRKYYKHIKGVKDNVLQTDRWSKYRWCGDFA